jgi:hypothetical protein
MSIRPILSTALIAATFVGVMLLPDQRPRDAGAQPTTGSAPKAAPDLMPATASKHELAVASGEEVFIVAFSYDTARKSQPILATKTWSWKARDDESVPKKLKSSFAMTSECKPVDGGRKLIIAGKEGGVALVDRESGGAEFVISTPNRAYSGDLLPENRIAIVSGDERTGTLFVYDLKNPERPMFQQALVGARGVVWDKERSVLWAIGNTELRMYSLSVWRTPQATLKMEETFKLPQDDGSDLHLVAGKPELLLTTAHGLWRFDIDRRRFAADQVLGTRDEIKSISHHPVSKLLAYVQPEGQTWWSDRVRLLGEKDMIFPSSKIYKARRVP